jgi:F0F1-type ATP synthase membrane subunit c/vacuolar-type H+-ATPase subunit K
VTTGEDLRVDTGPDRALLAASVAFAAAAGLGSAVAIRDELPGEPQGITVPLSIPAGLIAGWGAAVAAPWPMPAAALIAAARAQRAGSSAATGALCAGIGLGCIAGTFVEPVTRRPRTWSPLTRLAITANIAASAALVVTGWRHFAGARR